MQKIRLIVINENTLGCQRPNSNYAGILHASVLRGSKFNSLSNAWIKDEQVRLASRQDFDNFNVSFDGYQNDPSYEYLN